MSCKTCKKNTIVWKSLSKACMIPNVNSQTTNKKYNCWEPILLPLKISMMSSYKAGQDFIMDLIRFQITDL